MRINWEIFTLSTPINYRVFGKVSETVGGARMFARVWKRVKTEKLYSPTFPVHVKQMSGRSTPIVGCWSMCAVID